MKRLATIAAVALTALGLTYIGTADTGSRLVAAADTTTAPVVLDDVSTRTVYRAMTDAGFNHAEIVADLHRHGIPEAAWYGPMPTEPGDRWTVHPDTVGERDARLASGLPAPVVGSAVVPRIETAPTPTTVTPAPTTAATSVVDLVNALPYGSGVWEPARDGYRMTAQARGWEEWQVDAWEPFIRDVVMIESTGCWNAKRGARHTPGTCDNATPGRFEDYGIAQVIRLHDPLLAHWLGFDSHEDIIASPYNSISAMLVLVEEYGANRTDDGRPRNSWCYVAPEHDAYDIHACHLVPGPEFAPGHRVDPVDLG